MGSIFSRGGEEEKEEEKSIICLTRLNQDLVFALRFRSVEEKRVLCFPRRLNQDLEEKEEKEKQKEKQKIGIMIFVSAFTFTFISLAKVIERKKKEENKKGKGKGKDASSSSSSSYSSLCDELQLLIMSKVPARSLVKFMRLSKTWRSWINKEHFFFGKCPQRTDGFFFFRRNPTGFIYTPLPTNDNYNEDLSYTPSTSSFPFPTIHDDGGGSLSFKNCHHTSNGLLLLSTLRNRIFKLLVHNPLTRQSVLLPMAAQKFNGNPLWIAYDPRRSPYFNVVCLPYLTGLPSLVLHIFSSRSWTWRALVTTNVSPVYSRGGTIGRAVTIDGQMFIDLTFLYYVVLIVDLDRTGKEDYVIVPLPPGLPPRPQFVMGVYVGNKMTYSALGMSAGNMMYAYTYDGVLLVYKLLHPLKQGGDYRWTLLIKDTSLPHRIASKTGTAPSYHVHARDFLLHVPVLLISADCSRTRRLKIFSYNFTNGSILELFDSDHLMYNVTPLSLCPLEFY